MRAFPAVGWFCTTDCRDLFIHGMVVILDIRTILVLHLLAHTMMIAVAVAPWLLLL